MIAIKTDKILFKSFSYETVKRILDFALAIVLLAVMMPFFVVISFLVFLETGKNPVFIQERGIALDKYRFRLFKFRTLKNNITGRKQNNILIKSGLSDCITFTGKFLRRSGLDELPQIINIIRGEMSFIGPRPLSMEDLELFKMLYPDEYKQRAKINSLPGITGVWQIFGNRSEGVKNLVELDSRYETDKSFLFDLFLAAVTLPVAAFGRHSDALTFNGNFKDNGINYHKKTQSHYYLFYNKS